MLGRAVSYRQRWTEMPMSSRAIFFYASILKLMHMHKTSITVSPKHNRRMTLRIKSRSISGAFGNYIPYFQQLVRTGREQTCNLDSPKASIRHCRVSWNYLSVCMLWRPRTDFLVRDVFRARFQLINKKTSSEEIGKNEYARFVSFPRTRILNFGRLGDVGQHFGRGHRCVWPRHNS